MTDAAQILLRIKNLLNSLPSEYRHQHKLKLSKIHSILSELNNSMDIPIVPSIVTPTASSSFVQKPKSAVYLQKELPTIQNADIDVESLLKTLQGDLLKDLKTSRTDLMKGTRENK